jgi:DNA processing protein
MTARFDGRDLAGGRDAGVPHTDGLDAGAPYAAALAGLPGAGPATLVRLLRDWTPEEAWDRVREGRLRRPHPRRPEPAGQLGFDVDCLAPGVDRFSGIARTEGGSRSDESWCDVARRVDPPAWWARHAKRGIGVTWPGHPEYPAALVDDPERPGVLFWRGCLRHLAKPCVAIVGTRRATPDGRSVAFELGRDLAAAGVCVVSGLALGIDGAAHAGAVSVFRRAPAGGGTRAVVAWRRDGLPEPADCGPGVARAAGGSGLAGPAGPAGIAASGVDVPYPRRHAYLWEDVVEAGVMLSENLPGRPAQAWRFPARNRIIAGMVAMVVVVESHAAGGSLITAEAAIARGIDVRVVPGPVHSPASFGSNQLLYDGPGPVRDARDVLDGLGIFTSPAPSRSASAPLQGCSPAQPEPSAGALDAGARRALDSLSWRPTSLNQVVARSGLLIAAAARALDSLEAVGMARREGEWWVRRTGGGPAP